MVDDKNKSQKKKEKKSSESCEFLVRLKLVFLPLTVSIFTPESETSLSRIQVPESESLMLKIFLKACGKPPLSLPLQQRPTVEGDTEIFL